MLADVVALMLAFFVLTFSMRDIVEGGRRTGDSQPVEHGLLIDGVTTGGSAADPLAAPLALAPPGGRAVDQLQSPEQTTGGAPSFAYLAAALEGAGIRMGRTASWHDDSMLVVALPEEPNDAAGQLAAAARQPLLAMAFLARRFELTLAVALPPDDGGSVAERAAQALRVRDWLADVTGTAAAEVTFAATGTPAASDSAVGAGRALLLAKPTTGDRQAGSP